MPWDNDSARRAQLPRDWHKRRARAKRDAGGQCQHHTPAGARCPAPGADADHRTNRDDHDDLQWLCTEHHKQKTQVEAAGARAALRARGRHPRERHPGLD